MLAHELSHVRNRDVLIATVAAGVAGLISTLGHVLQWGLMLGGGSRSDDDRGGGLAALAWIIVAPIIALLIQLAISRSREYGADSSGAALCGDPGRAGRRAGHARAVQDRAGPTSSPAPRPRTCSSSTRCAAAPRRAHGPAFDPPADRRARPPPAPGARQHAARVRHQPVRAEGIRQQISRGSAGCPTLPAFPSQIMSAVPDLE